ncbi:Response regulator receiver modulated metal dependent phosphohydrolase [Candidatus Desulfosporosinus infrequens]|uniref:Stage 0 sporulation protein A homolog n=1 Tax=Candidatus Desulfosporosinus infrequens TaxID=2043169 RepID=A0A2U3LL25_9FIRM|nr:Response regulator receiver modulated metal dependent phosphohydrolase [Candidatus Desulfosporosinus infrequens]
MKIEKTDLFSQKQSVLIVDDTPESIHILMNMLKDQYIVLVAINGERALKIATMDPPPDLILLDIIMPNMDGYEVCARLKANSKTANIPVLFVTALTSDENEAKGLELGALDYITKPFNPTFVKARVKNHLELKKYRDQLETVVLEKTNELMITRDVTIEILGSLAEFRDPETGGHIKRTMHYVRLLAEKLKDHPNFKGLLTPTIIEHLWKSAPLHDIGKVAVPDGILLKPGKLTADEFAEMKNHTIYGRDALNISAAKLGPNSFLKIAQEMAYTHHEKWDGSGYPLGLKSLEIPVSGRLMAVADVYDALITRRIYKPPQSHSEAIDIIRKSRGTAFDPEIVDVFLEFEDNFRRIALEFVDNEEEQNNLRVDPMDRACKLAK